MAFARSPARPFAALRAQSRTRRSMMPPQTLESRVTSLEQRMTELEQLPGRMDDLRSQVAQLHAKMDAEFSAVRAEIAEQGAASAARDEAIGIQMRMLHEDVISRLALLQDGRPARPKR